VKLNFPGALAYAKGLIGFLPIEMKARQTASGGSKKPQPQSDKNVAIPNRYYIDG
jgi:hypothetical protein